MQRLGTILAVLVLSGGVALAQSGGGSGAGAAGTTSGSTGTNAASQSGAGSSAPPSPADTATVGRAPGVNPANSQDATRRGNSSDRTLPAARNPQDLKVDSTGTPVIIAP